ncbi:arsenate reductase [Iodidimonas gelatinilytica]|uniref:Arsenate reductase n=1 Tax=Iodidimonas gelatinilytica TaxID=1236966 RepID=A0A5A7MNU5_9PROT|nr:low molecular weight phosphatase family protein [Iodidimonas gelatinilytica]GEQ97670.1 arsenate reductase [Iodidimonas gelatinilytica]
MVSSPSKADAIQRDSPRSVLFLCNRNAVRSPMAQALLYRHSRHRIAVSSAGLEAGFLDPFSVAVMDEVGIDLSDHEPQSLAGLPDLAVDLVVSLTPEAHHRAMELTRDGTCLAEYWPTVDPTLVEGNRDQRLDAYRGLRDGLITRIETRFKEAAPGHL